MPDAVQISVSRPTLALYDAHVHVDSNHPSTSGVKPAPKIASTSDDHSRALRRVFIGQMPASHARPAAHASRHFWMLGGRAASTVSQVSVDEERQTIRQHFLRRGGKTSDWEGHAGRDFLRSRAFFTADWARGDGEDSTPSEKRDWVGRTFEIGAEFWEGLEDDPLPSLRTEPSPSDNVARETDDAGPSTVPGLVPYPAAGDAAAHPHGMPSATPERPATATSSHLDICPKSDPGTNRVSISSTRPLLHEPLPGVTGEPPDASNDDPGQSPSRPLQVLRSALRVGRHKDRTWGGSKSKGKGKSVTFPSPSSEAAPQITRQQDDVPQLDGAQLPAHPKEVLTRSGSAIGGTSAGASVSENGITLADEIDDGQDIVMRDRMLMRAFYTRSEDLPKFYDEEESRKHSDARSEEWEERVVVWRGAARRRLEIYEDYDFPFVSSWKGRMRLAFVIPLTSSDTTLSVYSQTDLTFCMTCHPMSTGENHKKSRSMFFFSKTGTNIFVFKTKCRSRGVDWIWNLWRYLGGNIPRHIDVTIPVTDMRIRLSVPALSSLRLDRETVISTCMDSILEQPDYHTFMEKAVKRGSKVELCWRKGMTLEWVWLGTDVDGRRRAWEVLSGIALRQPRHPAHLELRLAEHYPTTVDLANGSSISEPPAVEGYLYRISAGTAHVAGARRRLYVSTHDGNLVLIPFSRAHPPSPPLIPPDGQTDEQKRAAWAAFRVSDTSRQGENLLSSLEYLDMRSILAIRWATATQVPRSEDVSQQDGNLPEIHEEANEQSHDTGLSGGNGMPNGVDAQPEERSGRKQSTRLRRSFELVLRSGHVLRYEARTRKNAREWIQHLKALASYWTRQHRIWARFEMDVTYGIADTSMGASVKAPPPSVTWYPRPKEPQDLDCGSPLLARYWNWCVLDGCRAIVKAGRLFQKTGFRKQFSHMYHILSQGYLIQYTLTTTSSATHRLAKSIPLSHAYVYSGQLAMTSLTPTMDERQGRTITRYYQDGLEATDTNEDLTFIIWYRDVGSKRHPVPHAPTDVNASAHVDAGEAPSSKDIPALGKKHRMLIFRARSKLERDAWCWALNAEIERVVRASQAKERKLREDGNVIP